MTTTQGPALRARLFGSSGGASGLASAVAAGQHTSEALRQATDKLAREQATSEAQVNLYRQKLGEAQVAVKKLEEAYVSQINANANLQAKVRSDYSLLSQLNAAVTSATTQHRELKLAHTRLAVQLAEADSERTALADAFGRRAQALAGLEAKYEESCKYIKGLQAQLDEAVSVGNTLVQEVLRAEAKLQDKAKLQAEAEQREWQLTADLAAVRSERNDLVEQMEASKAQVEELVRELAGNCSLLADTEMAKASLEATIGEREAEAQRLAGELASVQKAAKNAEVEHAAALEVKSCELQELAMQHTSELAAKLAELQTINGAKEGLEGELAATAEALEKLKGELVDLQGTVEATQMTQASKLEELCAQLQAAKQQHSKEMKALMEKHLREQEAETERTAKKLTGTMQEMSRVKCELEEERKKAGDVAATANELKKRISELEAAKDNMGATQAAWQERFARERAELEARLAAQKQELEEQRMEAAEVAAAATERERRDAAALAAVESSSKQAQELVSQHASKLEELAAEVQAKEAALSKLDQENGANLLRLDTLNESLHKCQDKLANAEAQAGQLSKALSGKDKLLEEREAELMAAEQRIKALGSDLIQKTNMLKGISQVAAHVAGSGGDAASPPAAAPGQTGGTHRSAAVGGSHTVKKVSIREPGNLTATSEDEESSEESSEEEVVEEETNPCQALVPARTTGKKQAEHHSHRLASQRPVSQTQQQQPASRPIITEVDSGDEVEEQAGAKNRPSQHQQRRAVPTPAPEEQEEEEDRQARGRKRIGRAASSKQTAGSKKPRGGLALSGMRGLFSMQTASQNVSAEVNTKRSGKATATSGHRKQMAGGGGGQATKSKKKPGAAVGAAMNLFGQEIFGAFGGYGGGYGFDDVSP